jgi:hypothetical protein
MMSVKTKPVMGSVEAGLIASVCCGGSLVFTSMGLGAFYGALGLWRYVPEVLAVGALSIVAINYFYYRRAARHILSTKGDDVRDLRRSMSVSAAFGLIAMAGSFVFLEWLNHAVVNPQRFMARPDYALAVIPGVPNIRLIYALASFFALALLWAMPFPHRAPERTGAGNAVQWVLRVGVLVATAGLLIALVFDAIPRGGHGRSPVGQHSPGHERRH